MTPAAFGRRAISELGAPALVAGIALALLVPFVALDPVRGVTVSNSPFSDEVWNVLNARNLVLLGTWSTDQWNLYLLNGPFSVAEAAAFALLGVGMVAARLVPIACIALAGAVIVIGSQRWVGRLPASIAGLAYVTSALALFYGRLAYVEPMTGLFLVIGIVAIRGTETGPLRWGALAGAAFALAIATKALALPFVGTVLLGAGWIAIRDVAYRRWVAGAAATLLAFAAVWVALVWFPHREEIAFTIGHVLPQLRFDASPVGLARILRYPIDPGGDGAIVRSLPLVAGAAAALALTFRRRAELPPAALRSYAVITLALGASLLVVAAASYHPNRYIVPFLAATALLVGPGIRSLQAALSAGRGPGSVPFVILALVTGLLCGPGLVQHLGWMATAGRTLPAMQDTAASLLPRGRVVGGAYAALVAFEAPVEAVVTAGTSEPANAGDLYTTRGARYVVSGVQPPDWALAHPAAWDAREVLLCFTWGAVPQEYCLYRLP